MAKKKKSKAGMTRKQQFKSLKKLIQEREARENALRKEIWDLEQEIFLEQTGHQWDIVQNVAKQFEIPVENIESILHDIHRRHRIQGKRASRGFETVEQKAREIAKKDLENRHKMRKRYLKLHRKKIKARAGNPELKFLRAEGAWSTEIRTPDRGMIGWGFVEPDTGSWAYETDMEVATGVDSAPPYMFYPKARVDTGDIDNPMELEIRQTLVLSRPALVAGRGDFQITGLRADVFGGGLSQARMGDFCFRGHNLWDNTELSLHIEVFQIVDGVWMFTDLANHSLETGSGSHVQPIRVELGTEISTHDVQIRNNGLEPWLYINLKTRVSAADKDAYSEVNCSREDGFGLEMGCMTLIGGYE